MTPSSDPTGPNRNEALSAQTLHDLRTPLAVIQAHAQMLERWVRRNDLPDGEAALVRLSVITAMVARQVLVLNELREADSDEPKSDKPKADGG